jgi:transcriptional regulator of acetoin/glycerol metabolism
VAITPDDLDLDVEEDEADDTEKARILRVLEECQHVQVKAARALGISRQTLLRRLRAWKMLKKDQR